MKHKPMAFLVLAIALASPLSAMDGQIGITVGCQWNTEDFDFDRGTREIPINISGSDYFGRDGGFGVEYGAGLGICIGGGDVDSNYAETNSQTPFFANVGAGWRFHFDDTFGVKIGLGVDFRYMSNDNWKRYTLGAYGRVALDITFADHFRLDVGARIGGPLHAEQAIGSLSGEVDVKGVYASPYVGLAYVY